MTHETLIFISTALGCLLAYVAVQKILFYTKSEIDSKIKSVEAACTKNLQTTQTELDAKIKNTSDELYDTIDEIKENHIETKDKIYEKLLEAERQTNKLSQDIHDRLNQNKQIFDDYNKSMLEAISAMKQDEKQLTADMLSMVNTVKDELKTDSINRYNDLLTLVNSKVNSSDFDRLEDKFDKVAEIITELKTIIQIQKENKKS